jgi:uncharacterized protein YerC
MAKAKRQQVAGLLHRGMAIRDICPSACMSERFVFKVKKLLRHGRSLKIVRTGGLKEKKWAMTVINSVADAVVRDWIR